MHLMHGPQVVPQNSMTYTLPFSIPPIGSPLIQVSTLRGGAALPMVSGSAAPASPVPTANRTATTETTRIIETPPDTGQPMGGLQRKNTLVGLVVCTLRSTEPQAVVDRRAKDGRMATADRTALLDHPPPRAVARPPGLATAAPAPRRTLRPRPTHRRPLAAGRGARRGFPSILLLPR